MTNNLKIGGITPLTTVDYPGQLAAVVFCQGCPWRCHYCHNHHLIPRKENNLLQWNNILNQLKQRIGFLDAVVFSGGEPTLQSGLSDAIDEVKKLGFKTGLHTAGCYPKKLKELLPKLDWVGIDIKSLIEDYTSITNVSGSGNKAWESLRIIQEADIDYEVRITIHDNLLNKEKLITLLKELSKWNIPKLALQQCNTQNTLNPNIGYTGIQWQEPKTIKIAHKYFKNIELRN